VSPAWWPVLATLSPAVGPWLAARSYAFGAGQRRAEELNTRRIEAARPLDMPALRSLDLTVVVEQRHDPGFLGAAAVSYLVRSERGSLLMDVGGADHPALEHNARKLGLTTADIGALLISHRQAAPAGGLATRRRKPIRLPANLSGGTRKPCLVPADCEADALDVRRVERAVVLDQGMASTGPLARMLYFRGMMEEQAVVARLKDRGLVVLIGAGHPAIESILALVRRLSDEPLYAIGGGLNLPVTGSRRGRMGVQTQRLFGTGKPVWDRIDEADLDRTIVTLNRAAPQRLLLSAHNSCDHALDRLGREVVAEVEVLRAGATYRL
jgi:7,8-dihydropterin-6-yl-methyl-4-(beta-D-ribofuranosyl)aminobenzene 5'-phosphate synthase